MKKAIVIVVAVWLGSWLCAQFLALAWFARSYEFYQEAFPFLAGLFVVSAVLAFLQPPAVRGVLMGLSLPTVVWCVFAFSQIQLEIRMYPAKAARGGGWEWIGLAVVVISITAGGFLIGYFAGRMIRRRTTPAIG